MQTDEDSVDISIKLVICGEAGVGKTNLLSRYVFNTFDINSKSTIGVEFYSKQVSWRGKRISVQLFDTVGQEKFRSVCSNYFRNADGVVLVYDVTHFDTFTKLTAWRTLIGQTAKQDIPILLVGNKTDLKEQRRVTVDEGQKTAQKYSYFFMETSALSNENDCVHKAFELVIDEMCKSKKEEMERLEKDFQQIEMKSLRLAVSTMKQLPERKGCCGL